jgi:hypothetical protein
MKEEEKQIQKGTRRWRNVTGLSSVEFAARISRFSLPESDALWMCFDISSFYSVHSGAVVLDRNRA